MANINVKNQIGITVFFLVPNPNCLNEPSFSYKNAGSTNWTIQKITTNKIIETEVIFLRIYCLYINNLYID